VSPGIVGVRYQATPGLLWVAKGRPSISGSDRAALVGGTYIPSPGPTMRGDTADGATTGVIAGTDLTTVTGDQIITTAGQVVENLDVVNGRIIVRAANVTIRNCWVGGHVATGNSGLIDATHANCVGLVVEDCTLIPDNPSYWWNAIMGRRYTIRRCHWQWTVDGCRDSVAPGHPAVANPGLPLDIIVEQNYGGPLSFFSPDPNHTGDNRVHSDHIQIESGMAYNHDPANSATWTTALTDIEDASIVVRYNSFWGWYAGGDLFPDRWPTFNATTSNPLTTPPNSVLSTLRDANTSIFQVTPNRGVPVTGVWYEHNWCQGGSVGVSLAGGAGSSQRNIGRFVDNIFDGMQKLSGLGGTSNAWCFSIKSPEYGNRDTPELLGVFTGNTNTASGGAARLGRVTA
jgi:hypothetical protein